MTGKKEKGSAENRMKQNLFRLLKLQFLQRRFLYLGLMFLEFVCFVFSIVVNLRNRVSFGGGIHSADMGGMLRLGMLLVVLVLCLGNYNVVDNKYISMYPGTKTTRYFSRIILDILFCFCFTVWLTVLYLLSYGIYQVIHYILSDVNLLYFFSWKYLLERSTWFFALFIMMYGLVQLAYIILYFLGRSGYLIIWGSGLFVCIVSAGMLIPVYHLLNKSLSWEESVGTYLLAGVISMAISSVIVLWKKKPLRIVYGSTALLIATTLIFEIGMKLAIEYQNFEKYYDTIGYDAVEEAKEESDDKRIRKEFVLSWEEGNRMEFLEGLDWIWSERTDKEDVLENCLVPQIEIISVSDMKYGNTDLFDATKVTKEKFVLWLEANEETYNGKPVYQEVMDGIVLKKKKNQLYYDCKNFYYVLNLMFGSMDKFVDIAKQNDWDWGKYDSVSDGMCLKAIIDDETMKEWKLYQENGRY